MRGRPGHMAPATKQGREKQPEEADYEKNGTDGATGMTRILTRLGRRALVALLVGSVVATFAFAGVVAAQADPIRTLPARVVPGQEFQVTIAFISPVDNFNIIGLEDWAPAGWNVSVDHINWCTPPADFSTPVVPWTINKTEYLWLFNLYNAGDPFDVAYRVRVPSDALPGTYTFSGLIRYYIGAAGPFEEDIEGDPIDVVYTVGYHTYPVDKLAVLAPWIALLMVIIFGGSWLVVMGRRVQT